VGQERRFERVVGALGLFGQPGVSELIYLVYLVGHYCFVSMTLNGFDIPVPDGS
jgi:hypothetical protein